VFRHISVCSVPPAFRILARSQQWTNEVVDTPTGPRAILASRSNRARSQNEGAFGGAPFGAVPYPSHRHFCSLLALPMQPSPEHSSPHRDHGGACSNPIFKALPVGCRADPYSALHRSPFTHEDAYGSPNANRAWGDRRSAATSLATLVVAGLSFHAAG